MYIEPNTNIKILKGVPLDTTYEHTIYFEDEGTQINYFSSLTKHDLRNYTYQRVQKGKARVGIRSEKLYDCNYMMFQNSSYGNKWFYAFITDVEYVNNETSEITFEIDVMQTWFFNYEPDYCFVEREHSVTDNIGDNIIPENVDCGEYVYNGYGKITQILDPLCVMIMISDKDKEPDGTLYDGVYGGCTLFAYNTDDTESIKGKLSQYEQKPDAIVGMYMCPVIAIGEAIETGGKQIVFSKGSFNFPVKQDKIIDTLTLEGYTPRNNKMYTYPYNFLEISSGKSSSIYRYEFFKDLTAEFEINVPITMPLQVALRPKNYKGSDQTLNNETLILDDYPMCSWSTDAFSAWLAQNSLPIASTVGAVGISAVLGVAGVAFPPLGVLAGAGTVMSLLGQGYKSAISADITKGNVNSGNIDVSSGKKTFYGGRCSVTKQYARMIDNFFSKYGYATKVVKKPNRNSRPHWNYVKTVDATISGSVPADDMSKICDIYNKGITFWKKGEEVGDYSLDNEPA